MASIKVHIDEDLIKLAYPKLQTLGVTPSELMRQTLRYVAEHGQLPFEPAQSTKEEIQLAKIRHRIASPQRVKVSLKDL
ncbi:type II toxin-antitoxin system RelB/DinJ family antitoxin [Pseudomonas putida]|nr:type II toxin-antitoxin system RelB/DinJ family antitoxin [Pseudomonas putida]